MREIAVVLVAASSALVSGQTGARASSLPLASDMPVIEHAEIILGPDGTKDRGVSNNMERHAGGKIDHWPSNRRIRPNSARSGRKDTG